MAYEHFTSDLLQIREWKIDVQAINYEVPSKVLPVIILDFNLLSYFIYALYFSFVSTLKFWDVDSLAKSSFIPRIVTAY